MAKLPEFKNDDEFADFVDTHDMADYWDEFEEVLVKVKHPKKKQVTLRLYSKLIAEIQQVARQHHIPYQVLIEQWLAERMSQERQFKLNQSASD